MKYYCKNCDTEITLSRGVSIFCNGALTNPVKYFDGLCPICDEEIVEIHDYETPEQYEERKGEHLPDNRLVWYKTESDVEGGYDWKNWIYAFAKEVKPKYIVVAEPPIKPPIGWKPEE